ncbi:MAG: VCBS repeat domain-containing M23 family metallopeptidase [Parcubacteria group bacterium]|nr:VCBS repeat domain-containing M23 family metallopeptidase [Parcubacteria group bacterium]
MNHNFLPKLSLKLAGFLLFSFILSPFIVKADNLPSNMTYPVDEWEIVQDGGEFGYERKDGIFHLGADVPKSAGEEVYSFMDGTVRHVGIHSRFGTVILVEHSLNGEKIVSLYGHLRGIDVIVKEGQSVKNGQLIGYIGAAGPENGYWSEHLHFGIRKGKYVDTNSTWVYWGLGSEEEMSNWYDPALFLGQGGNILVDINQKSRIITVPGLGGNTQTKLFNKKGVKIDNSDIYASSHDFDGGGDVAFGKTDGEDNIEEIIIGAGAGDAPYVKIYKKSTKKLLRKFLAYDEGFMGGIRVATGDLDGDGIDEIITAAGPGGAPHIRVFDNKGSVVYAKLFPFGDKIHTGADVACGDIDGDGRDEIIVSTGPGDEPKVATIDENGKKVKEFLAYDKNFRGGVRISAGDVDRDGEDEIIAGAGPGGGPHVRVFEANGTPRGIDYFPFHIDFRGGVDVGSIDYDQDGKDEIIMTQSSGGQAWVKVYRYNDEKIVYANFLAYPEYFEGGVSASGLRISSLDTNDIKTK